MHKVVMPAAMAAMDQATIKAGTPGFELMEKAGAACTEIIGAGLSILDKILVICGGGNNGGDGFVIARLLANEGRPVRVLCTADPSGYTSDSKANFDRLFELEMPVEISFYDEMDAEDLNMLLNWSGFIVDCIFGNGLTERALSQKYLDLITAINHSGKPVTAIDIPSGLRGDLGKTVGACVKALRTIAIQCIKIGCLLNDGPDYCGEIIPVDIDITGDSEMGMVEHGDLIWPLPRKKNTHKYDYGAVCAVVGSEGMYGAGQMACEAALTVGCGLVTAHLPQSCFPAMSVRLPAEIMITGYTESIVNEAFLTRKKDVILFGCGVGRRGDHEAFFKSVFAEKYPIVIDADGLWHLSAHLDLLKKHQAPVILTPHIGEMATLTGLSPQQIQQDPVNIAKAFSQKYNVILVLKGYRTMIVSPEGEIRFNSTGNPGMATAGSGDVLAGMIAGILAQGLSPFDAAIHGVYYHGASGDVFAGRFSETTLRATDILSFLKVVINEREG